jgi:AcrR family transcriptional regulator
MRECSFRLSWRTTSGMRTVGSIGEETAKLIRRNAIDLIAEHGYEAMSLRQLANQVGIKAGSLYNHIGSKQDLLCGLLRAVMEDLLASVKSQVLTRRSPLLQFQAFVQLHIQFHVERRNEVLIATTELRSLNPENLRKIVKLRNRYEATLSLILKHGRAARVFSVKDTKMAALALIPLLTGVSQWYRPGGRMSRESLTEEYSRLCLAMVGANRKVLDGSPTLEGVDHDEHLSRADFRAKPRRPVRRSAT